MEKKVALVTGCSGGGIGFAFCQKLVERGYTVYATARRLQSMDGLEHPQIRKLALDVTDDNQVQMVIDTILQDGGQIDLVINNAGVLAPGPTIDYTSDQIKTIYDTNVFSILRVCRAAIPAMAKRRKGTIVNMGSIVGEFPTPWMGVYDSSKAAVRIMSEVLSLECKPFNIHVMLVAPGSIQSRIIDRQDGFTLPPNSMYGAFFHNILERLEAARGPDAMPTEDFAEEIISKADSSNPPAYVLTGGKAAMFRFMSFLPRSWVLSIVWNMFSKPQANKKTD